MSSSDAWSLIPHLCSGLSVQFHLESAETKTQEYTIARSKKNICFLLMSYNSGICSLILEKVENVATEKIEASGRKALQLHHGML